MYTDNEAPSKEAMQEVKEFCENSNWEAELKDFTGVNMLRFVTKCAITTRDVKALVQLLSNSKHFKEKIYHVHTGAHCTPEGNIGTAQP